MSTINSANVQVGQSNTPANNITLSTSAGGDLVVSKGASSALVEITRIKNNGEMDASKVGYTPAGTGAVATTVQSKLRERVSVLDFGAVGDGVTDDTAAIQAAVNAVANTKKRLFAPDGDYLIGGITISGSVWLDGAGKDVSRFVAKSGIGTSNMFYASAVDGITITNCGFDMRNDAISGTRLNAYLENIFCFVSCSNVYIEKNDFTKAINYTIIFNASSGDECENVYIRDNNFSNGARGAVILARYGRNFHVTGNRMTNVCNQTFSGIDFDKSISLSGVIGAWIEDNYVDQTIAGGGTIIVEYADRQSEKVTIKNNVIIGLADNSIKAGASVDVRIIGNSCLNSNAVGIYIEGCKDTIIDGNYIEGSAVNAIRVYEDAQTARTNSNITIINNILKNSNVGAATLGVPGGVSGSDDSYHLACRQTQYIYIRNNVFIDDSTSTAGGIWMQGQQYYIEGNNFLQLKSVAATLYNTNTTIGSAYNIENNAGMQTTASGSAVILNGTNNISVPDTGTVIEATNGRVLVTPNQSLSGTAVYCFGATGVPPAITLFTRTSAHGNANMTVDTSFTWSYSVKDAIGVFGKTAK